MSTISGEGIIPGSSDVCHTVPGITLMLEIDSEAVWSALKNKRGIFSKNTDNKKDAV